MTVPGNIITLEGAPELIGRALGQLWGESLPVDTERFYETMAREAGLEADVLINEASEYEARMRDLAPHMLVELAATAETAGVPVNRFLGQMAHKYCHIERVYTRSDWLEPRHGCTSFMATGRASGLPANLVHKNRDARQVPQSVHIKHVTGKRRVLGAGDVGDIGLCHALNADGLAGKTNSGNPVPRPLRHSISTTEILRHIVEECATCEQALTRMRELSKAGLITNGAAGCIWLFVDRQVGLIVEEVPFGIAWRFVEDEVEARQNEFKLSGMRAPGPDTPRYADAIQTMRQLAGRALPESLNRLGRTASGYPDSICHDTTNSATTSVVPHDQDAAPYWEMAVGHPANTFYLPMSPRATGLPRSLVDGSFWGWSARLRPTNKAGENPPLDFEAYEARFRESFARAKTMQELTEATAKITAEAERVLRGVCRRKRATGE